MYGHMLILTELLNLTIEHGTAHQVEWLLKQGAHPEGETTDEGFSPLYRTCVHRRDDTGRVEIARLLLDAGADANRATATRSNVAMAARLGRAGLVRLLLERGADPTLTMEDFEDGVELPLINLAQQVNQEEVVRVVREVLLNKH